MVSPEKCVRESLAHIFGFTDPKNSSIVVFVYTKVQLSHMFITLQWILNLTGHFCSIWFLGKKTVGYHFV